MSWRANGCDEMDAPGLRILYVDDELSNLKLVQAVVRIVLKRPDEVITAPTVADGLQRLNADAPFDVVLSDQRMPGGLGTDFLEQARQLQPAAARVLVTGHPDDPAVRAALSGGLVQAVIEKPWDARALYATVCAAVDRARAAQQ